VFLFLFGHSGLFIAGITRTTHYYSSCSFIRWRRLFWTGLLGERLFSPFTELVVISIRCLPFSAAFPGMGNVLLYWRLVQDCRTLAFNGVAAFLEPHCGLPLPARTLALRHRAAIFRVFFICFAF